MFKIDLSSKRAKLALRFFTYGVMTVSTILISIVLLFFALGYRFDRNFNFSQGGLVQFRSFPENAEVTVDGAKQDFRTPNKLNLTTGNHSVEMKLAGYHPWSKSFALEPGQLLWLNYTRFIPQSVTTTSLRQFDTLAGFVASPDRHWIILLHDQKRSEFTLADVSNEKEPKYTNLSLPDSLFTKKDNVLGTLQIVEWDLGARYVLIKHTLPTGETEFIRMDRTKPAEAINITREFRLNTKEAHFSGNDPNIIFANTDGILRRLNLSNTSASAALVNDLEQFLVYGSNTIAFTATPQANAEASTQKVIGILKDDKVTVVRNVALEKQVVLAYSEYDSHDYLAIAQSDSKKVEILRDPAANGMKEANGIFAQFELDANVRWLSFSNNGRMLVAQNGNMMASYDLEEAKQYQKTLNFKAEITTQLQWLDDFYLWSTAGNKLHIVEFDGQNEREITSLDSGFGVLLSSNGKRLFSVGKAEAPRLQLQSSQLVINE